MAGVTNSWLAEVTNTENPCVLENGVATPNNWLLWLIAGILIGSLSFQKKKGQS